MSERYKFAGRIANVTSAKGVRGCLFESLGEVIFRVEHGNGKFTDYKFQHSDLFVTIDDDFASFYMFDGETEGVLTESPSVLGLEKE